MYADQALRIMFDRGLFTAKPQIPRLILLDVGALEGGTAFLKRICADARTCDVPVVVLSASRDLSLIEDCYSFGARTYARKPTDPAEYDAEIERVAYEWLTNTQPLTEVECDDAVAIGLTAGADDYLNKRSTDEQIKSTLHKALSVVSVRHVSAIH